MRRMVTKSGIIDTVNEGIESGEIQAGGLPEFGEGEIGTVLSVYEDAETGDPVAGWMAPDASVLYFQRVTISLVDGAKVKFHIVTKDDTPLTYDQITDYISDHGLLYPAQIVLNPSYTATSFTLMKQVIAQVKVNSSNQLQVALNWDSYTIEMDSNNQLKCTHASNTRTDTILSSNVSVGVYPNLIQS